MCSSDLMKWWEKAEQLPKQYNLSEVEYWNILPRNLLVIYSRNYATLAMEDQVGSPVPLPLGTTLQEANDMMCAGRYFHAVGVVYSGPDQQVDGIWYFNVETMLYDPIKVMQAHFPDKRWKKRKIE